MTAPTVVLASRNQAKVGELQRILAAARLPVTVVGSDAFADLGEIPETGETFAENAAHKAEVVGRHTGLIAVADDSGLCVDALNGMPGVLSARWSGSHGNDETNLRLVIDQLRDVPDERRTGGFTCAAAAFRPGDVPEMVVRVGEVRGRLLRAPRGTGGFGYDPIFVPEGEERTTAEMSPDEKDAISHRGRAFRDLAEAIRTWFA
ncbi:MAG: RdgB/HAM1 family non-canonical purine NTP pyrophosphatase [Candidatus Nanopelagicales bacterium]